MMRSRWLSTFTLLGLLLVLLGIVGKIIGPKFVYDPGQIPDGNEALCYLVVGGLMLLNGFLSPSAPPEDDMADTAPPASPDAREAVPLGTDERTGD